MSIVFLLILFLLSCCSTVISTKEDEIMLLKMKKQLGNPDILRKWVKGFEYCGIKFYKPPDSFVYIACTGTGRVSNLRFKNIDFSATFPYAICGLTELVSLHIYKWLGLHGPIPPCIRKLVNLNLLVITETWLSDSLPNFSKNTNLIGIILSSNHLSGTIPPSLSKLQNLRSLDLSSNYITGTIPPKIVRGHNPKLFLSNNNLTGEIPKSYKSVNFEMINVGNNHLSGDASFLFGEQKTTIKIVLANNDFGFDLSFVKFLNLDKLDLSHNKIYGNVPYSTGTADSLWDLNLSFNRLCGELPKGYNMGRFNAAVFANNACLCGNPLPPCFNSAPTSAPAPVPESTTQFASAPAPAPVSTTLFESAPPPNSRDDEQNILLKMKEQLDNPDILRYWVKGAIDYCGGFPYGQDSLVVVGCTDTGRVSYLIIRNLDVYAPFPDAICEFTEIERLEISHLPGLHGLIPPCISKLVKLRSLHISKTSLSGYVPNFSNNTNLLYIILSSNQLSGTIPQALSTLPNLRFLDLGSNYLTGTIPPGLVTGDTPALFLTNNNLTGEIPKSYGSVNLFMIRVGNNLLNGDASFLFGKQMADMELANNDFEFDLSFVEFSDKLYNLDLSHNKIYGNVPDSIASVTELRNLNLSFNRLCGELPKGGNMGRFNAAVFANNKCLCGNPLPPCFNLAPAPTPESTTPQVPL